MSVFLSDPKQTPVSQGNFLGMVLEGPRLLRRGFLRKVNVRLQSARLFRSSIVRSHSDQRRMTVLTDITLASSDECEHVSTLMAGEFAMEDDLQTYGLAGFCCEPFHI